MLNTPIKIYIPGDSSSTDAPVSLPTTPSNLTTEEIKTLLKTKKPTCSGITASYSCGNHDSTPQYSGSVVPVNAGDEVAMNSLVISIVDIDGSGNGSGMIKIPMFNNAKVGVTFSGIKVAEGGCIEAGRAELSGVDLALLNAQQRAKLDQAYSIFQQATDAIYNNADAIAETINDLKDFIAKAKDFAKNYKGSKAEGKKAKAYDDFAEKARAELLKNADVPDSLKQKLTAAIAAAKPAWEFFKTGQPCTATSSGGGGNAYFSLPLADCAAYSKLIEDEMAALEAAEGSLTCNCSPIISDCSPIRNILDQIKVANTNKEKKISITKVEGKTSLSNDTNWISALNGIDIEGKCFKIALNFGFDGESIELNPNEYKETKNGIDIVDIKGKTLLSINLIGESGQNKYYKIALLKKYLGFEEKKIPVLKIYLSDRRIELIIG